MKRKGKIDKGNMEEEISLDLGIESGEEGGEMSEMAPEGEMGSLSAASNLEMVRELKARGILPEDFEEPEEEAAMPTEEEEGMEIEI